MGIKGQIKKAFFEPHHSTGFTVKPMDVVRYEEAERQAYIEVKRRQMIAEIQRQDRWWFGYPEEEGKLDEFGSWDYFRDTEEGRQEIRNASQRSSDSSTCTTPDAKE